jgi:DNA-binding response OmpR family regulator
LFQVDVFNDPELALSKFAAGLYDLIIIDIRMPKMNGFTLCKNIKKIDNKVKVYFFTAGELNHFQQEDADIINALGEQKDCFISKPIGLC